jgi:hypothetical protein
VNEQQRLQRETNFAAEIKDKLKELVQERQEDINMIAKMLENNLKKVSNEVGKLQEASKSELVAAEKKTKETVLQMMEDKVRVDEVQDALKRMTESFNFKLEQIQDHYTQIVNTTTSENSQALAQHKDIVDKLVYASKKRDESVEVRLSEIAQAFDECREGLDQIAKQAEEKTSRADVVELLD